MCFPCLSPPPAWCYPMGAGTVFFSLDFHLPSVPFVPYRLTVLFLHFCYISSCPLQDLSFSNDHLYAEDCWIGPFHSLTPLVQLKAWSGLLDLVDALSIKSAPRALLPTCLRANLPYLFLPCMAANRARPVHISEVVCVCFSIVSMALHICCKHCFCLLVPLVRVLVCEPWEGSLGSELYLYWILYKFLICFSHVFCTQRDISHCITVSGTT